jgi:murein L,D-transpeptidase YcbB/YkuD
MRVARLLAVSLVLASGSVSAAFAVEPDNVQTDGAHPAASSSPSDASQTAMQPQPSAADAVPQQQDNAKPAPASDAQAAPGAQPEPASQATAPEAPAPSTPAADTSTQVTPPKIIADDHLVYLPVASYIDANAKKLLAATNADDRQALIQFYRERGGSTLWVDKNGSTPEAKNLIAALNEADSWGLRSADYKIPELKPGAAGDYSQDDLTAFETRLSLDALGYARDARGGRIGNPSSQLGTYLDRTPQVLNPSLVIGQIAVASDKGDYLKSLHPKHEQFLRLRDKLLALRASAKETAAMKIPDGPLLKPGAKDSQIATIRKRLKVASPAVKDDGTSADDTYYDKTLADAVIAYKKDKGIQPPSTTITSTLRRSLNASNDVSEAKLIANMEEWRWMPEDLGKFYVMVNIPEFKVRVISNGEVIHEERIVSGRPDAQSPIFSELMRTVVIQPRWNVPNSIKIKELLPSLRGGSDPLRRQGLVLERNGRKIDPYNVDWNRSDIRNFDVYQPPGGGNALGVVKFLFPNKHSVYLHDTPSKGLFNESVRAFSHGCMRVRNPVKLAELILNKDKGWDKATVDDLVAKGPEENEVSLDQPIPVHVTYFTAWVDNDGEVQTFDDVYGHEKRITLALAGRWNQIVKADEKQVSPDDIPDGGGWSNGDGGIASLFGDDDDDRDDRGRPRKHGPGLGNFFKQVFGGF